MTNKNNNMIDLTKEITTATDVHMKITGSKLTRINLLMNKLNIMAKKLDKSKPIITEVWEKDDFVERVSGKLRDTREILNYYNQTFVIRLTMNEKQNKIFVYLDKTLPKEHDLEF